MRWRLGGGLREVNLSYPVVDAGLRTALEVDGYAVVPLLDHATLERVRGIRPEFGPAPADPRTGLFNDTWSDDRHYRRRVADRLAAELAAPVATLLPHHRVLGLVHIVKWPGEAGDVVAHRDLTFVDERFFRSLMVWCALEDVDEASGTIWVVPGSHRSAGTAIRVHGASTNLQAEVDAERDSLAKPLAVAAGSAIVYDHALIHLSTQNTGGRERVVVAGPVVPTEATASYPLEDPSSGILQLEIDDDFFVENRLLVPDVAAMRARHPRIVTKRSSPARPRA